MVSKKIMENVDLEEGKIKVKGQWLTEDEIRYAIRMKVDSDDYNVADLAVALKTLITEMNKSTVLRVRVPKELSEKLSEISQEKGESIESMLRIILLDFINNEGEIEDQMDVEPEDEEEEEASVELEAEIVEIIHGDLPEKLEIEEDDDDLDLLENFKDSRVEGDLLDLETPTIEEEPEKVQIGGDLDDEFSDIEDLDEEIEKGLKEFEPLPKPKKSLQKRVLRKKKLRNKKH